MTARIAARVAVVLALVTAACVSRSTGPQLITVPAPVPSSQLSGVTLQVGDQKGGTEALLRAAGALDNLPYRDRLLDDSPRDRRRSRPWPPARSISRSPAIPHRSSVRRPTPRPEWSRCTDGAAAGEQILVRTDSSIATVKDLKGKTILVAKGSAAHANVLEHLADAGLKPKDVKLVFLQPADALSAFANGQGDAWVIWDPYTAQANLTLKVRSIGSAENGYQFGSASVTALTDPNRNSALADLLVRYERAAQWARDNPSAVGQEVRQPPWVWTSTSPRSRRAGSGGCRSRWMTRWWPPSNGSPTCSRPPTRFRRRPISSNGSTVGSTVCSR